MFVERGVQLVGSVPAAWSLKSPFNIRLSALAAPAARLISVAIAIIHCMWFLLSINSEIIRTSDHGFVVYVYDYSILRRR